jgi:signal transduction histidine kinase
MPRTAVPFTRHLAFRYTVAVVSITVLLWACRALNPFLGENVAYIVLFPVVTFVSWYCGLGPSIVATVLAAAALVYWLNPAHFPDTARSFGALAAFLFASVIVVTLEETRRRDNERLRIAHGELETRVQERTADLDRANSHLQTLSARLLHLQDEERRRIARELHDSIGQLLAALSMNLSGVRGDIDRLTKTMAAIVDSESLVQEMGKEVRTISHLLHPPLLDEAGLRSALGWYVDGFSQRSKIPVDLDCLSDFGRLPRDVETTIFRLVQECLTNIHRHSGSATASIRLQHKGNEVIVTVRDNGKGIPLEKLEGMTLPGTAGVGITGMRERVRQLGGGLAIDSSTSGTKITARIPVPKPDVNEDSVTETSSSAA